MSLDPPSLEGGATLAGRVALVTGGGTGIGRATSLTLAALGADVVLAGRRIVELQETAQQVQELGRSALVAPCDVREPEQVTQLVDSALQEYGQVDVLVNNAGGQFAAPAEDITVKGWRAVHRLSVEAVWSVTREVATRSMIPRRSGVLLFLTFSPARGVAGMVHASAARAAVENLSAGLASEWSRYGLRTVAVAVGTVRTHGLDQYPPGAVDGWLRGIPLGRLGRAEEVAKVIAFLSTGAADYITGSTVVVDGGAGVWGSGPGPLDAPT